MIRNTMVASRTLTSNLTNKLLDMMTSDWFLKALEASRTDLDWKKEITESDVFLFYLTVDAKAGSTGNT